MPFRAPYASENNNLRVLRSSSRRTRLLIKKLCDNSPLSEREYARLPDKPRSRVPATQTASPSGGRATNRARTNLHVDSST
jgi:hypothetical protein